MGAMSTSCSTPSRLSKTDIQIAAGELRTFAAASILLVEQSAAGNTTDLFFSSQAELLRQKVRSTQATLDGNAGEFEGKRSAALDAAVTMSDVLEQMQADGHPSQKAEAGLTSIGGDLKTIEDQLKE